MGLNCIPMPYDKKIPSPADQVMGTSSNSLARYSSAGFIQNYEIAAILFDSSNVLCKSADSRE